MEAVKSPQLGVVRLQVTLTELFTMVDQLNQECQKNVSHLCFSGTSSSCHIRVQKLTGLQGLKCVC